MKATSTDYPTKQTLNVQISNLKCSGIVQGVITDLLRTGHCSVGATEPANLQLPAVAIPISDALSDMGVFMEGGMSHWYAGADSISCTATANFDPNNDTTTYACNVVAPFDVQ